MTQETHIEVHGLPLSSYFEEFVFKDIAKNALKVSLVVILALGKNVLINLSPLQGRQAMEFVINKINEEVTDIAHKTAKSVDETRHQLAGNTKRLKDLKIADDLVIRSAQCDPLS